MKTLLYILQSSRIPALGNQDLNNKSALGGNRVFLE